jgi:hypothetical protein
MCLIVIISFHLKHRGRKDRGERSESIVTQRSSVEPGPLTVVEGKQHLAVRYINDCSHRHPSEEQDTIIVHYKTQQTDRFLSPADRRRLRWGSALSVLSVYLRRA